MGQLARLRTGNETASALRHYGEELPRVTERLADQGALGIVLVDASPLTAIELSAGVKAHRRVTEALAALVEDTSEEVLGGDFVVAYEPGLDEIVVFVFRPRDDDPFYREELPVFASALADVLTRHASRMCYPYARGRVDFFVGHAFSLYNPTARTAKQVSRAREKARDAATLNARIHHRRLQQSFHELVLAESVTSVYEPIVNVRTRRLMGYESLIRGPAGSPLESPNALFAMAHETDLLFQLDCLCRRKGLLGARSLERGKKLFLNCLPSAIHDPDFREDRLRRTLEAIGLQPSDVVFEISEKETIDNFAIFREVRDHYHMLGFGIALDDVGVGYSGLETVMELAPDYIKLDMALVRSIDSDPHRRELVSALNKVSGKLGARIIAEGVTTEEELATLGEIGIPYAQGYLFGRGQPLDSDA